MVIEMGIEEKRGYRALGGYDQGEGSSARSLWELMRVVGCWPSLYILRTMMGEGTNVQNLPIFGNGVLNPLTFAISHIL